MSTVEIKQIALKVFTEMQGLMQGRLLLNIYTSDLFIENNEKSGFKLSINSMIFKHFTNQ